MEIMERSIEKVIFNWFYTQEGGENYSIYQKGKDGVVDIKEHVPEGEGDRWFYIVEFDNGIVRKIFNINEVVYE